MVEHELLCPVGEGITEPCVAGLDVQVQRAKKELSQLLYHATAAPRNLASEYQRLAVGVIGLVTEEYVENFAKGGGGLGGEKQAHKEDYGNDDEAAGSNDNANTVIAESTSAVSLGGQSDATSATTTTVQSELELELVPPTADQWIARVKEFERVAARVESLSENEVPMGLLQVHISHTKRNKSLIRRI
jgi:hypothetical protein